MKKIIMNWLQLPNPYSHQKYYRQYQVERSSSICVIVLGVEVAWVVEWDYFLTDGDPLVELVVDIAAGTAVGIVVVRSEDTCCNH